MGLLRRLVAVTAVGVLAACSASGEVEGGAGPTATTTAVTPVTGLPDTPAGNQLEWVLSEGAAADDAALAERFSADFLAVVPAEQVRTILDQLGTTTVGEVRSSTSTDLDVVVTVGDGTSFVATVSVEEAAPHRILGLFFSPAEPAAEPASWEEVDTRLSALAPRISFLAAEVGTDGSLTAVHERDADTAGPLGSAFKLYVLGALVLAVDQGSIGWDDVVTIEEVDRSLPSGQLQDRIGEDVSVLEAATLMISLSDNTATNLLMRLLSREAVEAMLEPMGMAAESRVRTLPFVDTTEMFVLKWGGPEVLESYASGEEEVQRAILESLPRDLPDIAAVDPTVPVEIERVEWFASPRELAAAYVYLDERRSEQLDQVLGTNPGVELDPAVWTRFAFKGGSEPGVLTLSWLLERTDGRRFVLVLEAWNPEATVDEGDGAAIAAGAISLLAAAS